MAGFISEWWPESNRNGGRHQIGIPGRIASEFACLIGYRSPDTGQWARWAAGEQLHFYVLYNAYVEWQKTVKSPVAPEPTHSSALGKVLTNAGFGTHRLKTSNDRILPDPEVCLKTLFAPQKKGTQ